MPIEIGKIPPDHTNLVQINYINTLLNFHILNIQGVDFKTTHLGFLEICKEYYPIIYKKILRILTIKKILHLSREIRNEHNESRTSITTAELQFSFQYPEYNMKTYKKNLDEYSDWEAALGPENLKDGSGVTFCTRVYLCSFP